MTFDEWKAHILIWGWAVDGHDALAVFTCEEPERGTFYGWWDGDAASLDGHLISHDDEPYHRPPDYWALPGVTELLIHQDQHPLRRLHDRADAVELLAEELLQ